MPLICRHFHYLVRRSSLGKHEKIVGPSTIDQGWEAELIPLSLAPDLLYWVQECLSLFGFAALDPMKGCVWLNQMAVVGNVIER